MPPVAGALRLLFQYTEKSRLFLLTDWQSIRRIVSVLWQSVPRYRSKVMSKPTRAAGISAKIVPGKSMPFRWNHFW